MTGAISSQGIAKSNPQSVNIQTPTATIAVRGTDFSMTVDELGRSLVMLLPSCDEKSCVTGAITVSNSAGSVNLDTAYQATLVSSTTSIPTPPVIIQIDQNNINNLLIISPPIKTQDVEVQSSSNNMLDFNLLNTDLLKYNKLDEDELKKFKELDINYLDNNALINMLDLSNQQLFANQDQLAALNKILPNYSELSGIRYYFNEDETKISLSRVFNHTAIVTTTSEQGTTVNLIQDGLQVTQKVNNGGTTMITIVQK